MLEDIMRTSSFTPCQWASSSLRLSCRRYPGLAGCTAVVAVVNETHSRLTVANAGDSRAVLCRAGKAVALSTDHKPSLDSERARIEAAGSRVQDGRVITPGSFGGRLSVSRGLGDREHKLSSLALEKQAVTAEPEVMEVTLSDGDEFVLLACDGIWDVMTSQEAVEFVSAQVRTRDLSEPIDPCWPGY